MSNYLSEEAVAIWLFIRNSGTFLPTKALHGFAGRRSQHISNLYGRGYLARKPNVYPYEHGVDETCSIPEQLSATIKSEPRKPTGTVAGGRYIPAFRVLDLSKHMRGVPQRSF